jgi:hypothetical protein
MCIRSEHRHSQTMDASVVSVCHILLLYSQIYGKSVRYKALIKAFFLSRIYD